MYDLKNQILIATPKLNSTQFEKAILFIIKHDEFGSSGLIINKISDLTLEDILEDYSEVDYTSVAPNILKGFCNRGGFAGDDVYTAYNDHRTYDVTTYINDSVRLTNSTDILDDIACSEGPEYFTVFSGITHWKASQLEDEINSNMWLNLSLNDMDIHNLFFKTRNSLKWQYVVNKIGIYSASHISSSYGHA